MSKEVIKKVSVVTAQQLKKANTAIKELLQISTKENEVILSRREKALEFVKSLNRTIDAKTGIDEDELIKSMAVMAKKLPKEHKQIKKTMFNYWCSLVDSKNNKGAMLKNGKVEIGGKEIELCFENLYGDENRVKALKISAGNNKKLHHFLMAEKDEGEGTGLKVQYKKWEEKEYNKIKNSLKPESQNGKGTSAISPQDFISKKVYKPMDSVKNLFKDMIGKKCNQSTYDVVNKHHLNFMTEIKNQLKGDEVYQAFLRGEKID
jgi:hypothetical protein